jgi:hypothetical protein
MLATFLGQRFYLHMVPIRHLYVAGHLVHHLFVGILIEIPAAFLLAFGVRNRLQALLAPAALGVGSAMVLDEAIYLTLTDGSDAGYRSAVSLWGAITLITLATGLLFMLYGLRRGEAEPGRNATVFDTVSRKSDPDHTV